MIAPDCPAARLWDIELADDDDFEENQLDRNDAEWFTDPDDAYDRARDDR